MFELKEYRDDGFSTFYFKDGSTKEVWMPINELRHSFDIRGEAVNIIATTYGKMEIGKDVYHYKISARFDALFESDLDLLYRGKETEPITCIRLTDICEKLELLYGCARVNNIQKIYFKEIINSNTVKPQPSTFVISCPHELMVRLGERIDEDDDIPGIAEAVVQALTFWLDNKTKQAPITPCDKYELKVMKDTFDTLFTLEKPDQPEMPDEPPSLPLFRPGYHLSIDQMADLYYRNFSLRRNQMFSVLRAMDILQQEDALPRRIYIELGVFDVVAILREGKTFTQAVLTPEGQVWLPKKISKYLKSLKE